VLVADDDWDTRCILSDTLAHHGYEPLVASDGEQALALATEGPLAVACVDLVMPGPAGLELIRRLKALQPQMEVILITAFGSTELAVEAMHQGAFYYLDKPLRPARLLEVVEEACAEQQAREQTLGPLQALTRREREALAWLAEGKTDPEIAQELRISKRTVSTHVRNLLRKLGVKNRVQAAVLWERCARGNERRRD
jgi:DNA-binding NarL/FixJ family response regulator